MTTNDLKLFFDLSDRQIAKTVGVSPSQYIQWKKTGIPFGRQAMIQLQTGGKLKANLPNVA